MVELEALYDEDEEQAILVGILDRRYTAILAGVHELVAAAFPEQLGILFRLDDAAVRTFLQEAAERVVRIDETTRQAIREQLQEGQRRGYSIWQLAHGVPAEDYRGIGGLFRETWRHRAETVAVSELAWAQTLAALDRYEATGFISRVQILEATDTDEPCASRANQIVPLSDRPMPLHPRCRVVVTPVVDE